MNTAAIIFDVNWQVALMLTLMHVAWIGVAIGLIAAIGNSLMSKATAQARYLWNLSAMLTIGLALPVAFSIVAATGPSFPVWPAELTMPGFVGVGVPARTPVATNQSPGRSHETRVSGAGTIVAPATSSESSIASVTSGGRLPAGALRSSSNSPPVSAERDARPAAQADVAPLIAFMYVAGVSVMLLRLVVGLYGGMRLRNSCREVTDLDLLAVLQCQCDRIGIRVQPTMAYCHRLAMPVVVGVLRPAILVPGSIVSGLSPAQLADVLAHELAHIRRCDHWLIVLQRLLESVLFFHPAIWYLSRRVSVERELSCDDLLIASGLDRISYARSLLRVAELSHAQSKKLSAAIPLAADGGKPLSPPRTSRASSGRVCLAPVPGVTR